LATNTQPCLPCDFKSDSAHLTLKYSFTLKKQKHTCKPPPHNRYQDKENYKLLCQWAGYKINQSCSTKHYQQGWPYMTHKVNCPSQTNGTSRGSLTLIRDEWYSFTPMTLTSPIKPVSLHAEVWASKTAFPTREWIQETKEPHCSVLYHLGACEKCRLPGPTSDLLIRISILS
jgi:hypothetical protein